MSVIHTEVNSVVKEEEEQVVVSSKSKLSDLWKTEDWQAVWIGFLIIAVASIGTITGWFDFSAAKFATWGNGSNLLEQITGAFIGKIILTMFVLGTLFTIGNSLRGTKVLKYVPAFAGLFVLAIVVRIISAEYTLNRYLEWAFFALLVGLVIANTVKVPEWLKPAVQTEFYIKSGLVIMGFSVLFSNIVCLFVFETIN